jgi:hypothetical protein
MPFIKYKGESIYFDTIEEAKAAIDGGMRGSVAAAKGGSDGPWTMPRFKDYVGRLSQPQVRMLQELVKSPHGRRTARDLASSIGFNTSKAFGPILAAMSKHAKKAGIGFEAVLKSSREDVGNETVLVFTAAPAFVRIASDAGWEAE